MKDAIFTPDQVESLNAYQVSGFAHPFTCGNHCGGVLVAKEDGWHCPNCDYTQDWAHGFMADWSWARQAASVAPWAKIPDRFTEPK